MSSQVVHSPAHILKLDPTSYKNSKQSTPFSQQFLVPATVRFKGNIISYKPSLQVSHL